MENNSSKEFLKKLAKDTEDYEWLEKIENDTETSNQVETLSKLEMDILQGLQDGKFHKKESFVVSESSMDKLQNLLVKICTGEILIVTSMIAPAGHKMGYHSVIKVNNKDKLAYAVNYAVEIVLGDNYTVTCDSLFGQKTIRFSKDTLQLHLMNCRYGTEVLVV